MTGFWARCGKRWFDLFLAIGAILALLPVLVAVAVLVRVKLGSPILFTQQRLGKGTGVFKLYKFRSMSDARDANGELLPDEQRLTRFGLWLRSSSIDELPQILNVLRNEMSFIGPRATLVGYRDALRANYPRRFEAMPGLTSLPAVRGRNALSWDDKFSMDVEYVENFGFKMDMYIFFKTIPVVLGRKGISMDGVATATRYDQASKPSEKK